MVKRFSVVETQSPDGEIHLILNEIKFGVNLKSYNKLDENKIREIMKREANKPLHLVREYE